MKQRPSVLFAIVTLTLGLGSYLSVGEAWALQFALFYGLSFFVLTTFKHGTDYFRSLTRGPDIAPENKVLLAGLEVRSETVQDKQEERFLNTFESAKVVKGRVYSWIFCALYVWAFHYLQNTTFAVSIVPLISCIFILNSSYVGHLLVPLFFTLVAAGMNLKGETWGLWWGVYAILFMASLYLIAPKTERADLTLRKWKGLMLLACIYLGISWGASSVLNDESPQKKMLNTKEEQKLAQFLRTSKHKLRGMENQLKGMTGHPGSSEAAHRLGSKIASNLSKIGGMEKNLEGGLNGQSGAQMESDMEDLMGGNESLQDEFDDLMKGGQGQGPGQLSANEQKALESFIGKNGKNGTQMFKQLMERHRQNQTQREHLQESLQAPNLGETERKAMDFKLGELTAQANEMLAEMNNIRPMGSDENMGNEDPDLQQMNEQLVERRNQNQMERERIQKFLQDPGMSGVDRKGLENKLEDLMAQSNEIEKAINTNQTLSHEEREAISSTVKRNKSEMDKLDRTPVANREAVQEKLQQGRAEIEQMEELLKYQKFKPEEKIAMARSLEKLQALDKGLKQELSQVVEGPKESLVTEQEEKRELMNTLKEKKNKDGQFIEKLMRMIPILVLVLIVLGIMHFMKKKGIKTVEAPDPSALPELREKWRALKRLSLSPKEEIIYYYNLFHESLQKIHYAEYETPPSCIVYEDMKDLNPDLEKSTYVITELYCHCFYGEKDVPKDGIGLFRKAMDRVLKVYRLV